MTVDDVSSKAKVKLIQVALFCNLPYVFLGFDFLLIVTPIGGFCDCSMFCCTLLYVHSSIAIILMGKRELVALVCLICLPGVS